MLKQSIVFECNDQIPPLFFPFILSYVLVNVVHENLFRYMNKRGFAIFDMNIGVIVHFVKNKGEGRIK